jgi:3-phenylpropionate/cinnamic acid dioxygenase small subunit
VSGPLPPAGPTRPPFRVPREVKDEIEELLLAEAELLDDRRFQDWLALFARDLRYEMPLRVSRETGDDGETVSHGRRIDDTLETLTIRVQRLDSEYAWAENPPSRTRHFVSNIRVEPTERPDEYRVRSNVLLYRSHGDSAAYNLLTADRRDVLRRTADGWEIARRTVILDQTTLATHNLSFFF